VTCPAREQSIAFNTVAALALVALAGRRLNASPSTAGPAIRSMLVRVKITPAAIVLLGSGAQWRFCFLLQPILRVVRQFNGPRMRGAT